MPETKLAEPLDLSSFDDVTEHSTHDHALVPVQPI